MSILRRQTSAKRSVQFTPHSAKHKNLTRAVQNTPRVALVCDWLTTPGGAEKVLLELHRLYPDAPIYTSQYSKKGINWFDDATVKTGWLQIFPKSLRKFLGPLRQIYFSRLDLSDYDLVISVTGAEAKSVRTKHTSKTRIIDSVNGKLSAFTVETQQSAFHLCYCHVPTQYYWQMYDKYLANPGFGLLNPLAKLCFKLLVKPLRDADYRAAQLPDQFVTISTYAQRLIQQYYHRDATIIAPPVEIGRFRRPHYRARSSRASSATTQSVFPRATAPYFVISCRQVTWKRVDLAIAACLKAEKPLLVIGDGPEHKRLVRLAKKSPLITFLPWLSASDLARYLQGARAYLFPSLEPFGIAAVEALAAGCPVIAFQDGGSRDFIQPKVNGLLFPHQTVASLERALHDFQRQTFDPDTVARTVQRFDVRTFRQRIQDLIQQRIHPHTP